MQIGLLQHSITIHCILIHLTGDSGQGMDTISILAYILMYYSRAVLSRAVVAVLQTTTSSPITTNGGLGIVYYCNIDRGSGA